MFFVFVADLTFVVCGVFVYVGGFVDPPHLVHEGGPCSVYHLLVHLGGSDVQFLSSDL